jgi:hypothetical protein
MNRGRRSARYLPRMLTHIHVLYREKDMKCSSKLSETWQAAVVNKPSDPNQEIDIRQRVVAGDFDQQDEVLAVLQQLKGLEILAEEVGARAYFCAFMYVECSVEELGEHGGGGFEFTFVCINVSIWVRTSQCASKHRHGWCRSRMIVALQNMVLPLCVQLHFITWAVCVSVCVCTCVCVP